MATGWSMKFHRLGMNENVFDIEQGVAIGIFAKGGVAPSSIGFHELWGLTNDE